MDIDINFPDAHYAATRTRSKAIKVAAAMIEARAPFYVQRAEDGYFYFYTDSDGQPILADQGILKETA